MRFPRSYYVSFLIAACASAPLALADDEVRAKRTPLKDWVDHLASDDTEARKSAAEMLLADYDGIFEPPDFDNEKSARQVQFRAELKPLFPFVRRMLESRHDDCRSTAGYLLAVMGLAAKDAEPALLGLLRAKETPGDVRMAAVTALLHVTPRSRAVLPALLEIYNAQGDAEPETEEESRRRDEHEEASAGIGGVAVALTLAQSGRAAIEVPTLVKVITGPYRRGIRLTFIYALAELEADCRAAVPALRKLILDDDRRIRSAAGWAVLRIEGDAAELPAILKAVGHDPKESAEFQNSVSMFLKEKAETVQWLSQEPDQIAALVRQVSYDNPFYQRQAIRFLGEIGPKAKRAIPTLITAARNEDKFTRDVARAALKQIEPGAVPRKSETDHAK